MADLQWLPGRFAVCRLDEGLRIPAWATGRVGTLLSVTMTDLETSIVCDEGIVPPDVIVETGWSAFRLVGTLDFSLVGVLAGLTRILAEADIAVFVISTYDTDLVLVKREKTLEASEALTAVGYRFV